MLSILCIVSKLLKTKDIFKMFRERSDRDIYPDTIQKIGTPTCVFQVREKSLLKFTNIIVISVLRCLSPELGGRFGYFYFLCFGAGERAETSEGWLGGVPACFWKEREGVY